MTLQLRRPGPVLLWTAVFLLLLAGGAEMVVRQPPVQARLPMPGVGSATYLDLKVAALEARLREGEPIDCLFLGASIVYRDLNPEPFTNVVNRETGQTLHCFNFGLPGSNPYVEAQMARLLVDLYRPDVLFLGLVPDTYVEQSQGDDLEKIIAENAWVQYRLGSFSVTGWLTDQFYLYRYFLMFQIWLERPAFFDLMQLTLMSRYGFGYSRAAEVDVSRRPDQTAEAEMFARFASPALQAERLAALDTILQLQDEATIIVFESPVHPTFLDFYGDQTAVRAAARAEIGRRVTAAGATFLPAPVDLALEDDDWLDRHHLNSRGAHKFSRWLGEQVSGELIQP